MTSPLVPPVKRSITIAGHATSVSLEPIFWTALAAASARAALPLNALVAQIDVERLGATDPPNLGSALRTWLLADALSTQSDRRGKHRQVRMFLIIVDSANRSQ